LTISTIQVYSHPVARKYKPPSEEKIKEAKRKLRFAAREAKRKEKQELFEEGVKVRHLLFCVGKGRMKNLGYKERAFIQRVKVKAYKAYLYTLQTGILRPCYKPLRRTVPFPYLTWQRIWYGAQLGTYRRLDLPRLAKQKWEELYGRNTDVPKLEGGRVLELGHEAGERERRNMDISMSNVSPSSSGEQGRSKREEQV
jgi:hypothetical protein